MDFAVELAHAMQRPQRVNRRAATLENRAAKGLDDALRFCLHQQALGGQTPEQVVIAQGGDQFGSGGVGQGPDLRMG